MPNWSENHIAIRGTKENVLAFVNEGLKNSGRETYSDVNDIERAVADLMENGKALEYTTSLNKTDQNVTKGVMQERCNKGIWLGTFRPMPEIFRYDTTNHKEMFPEQAKEQREKYGVVGWYNYNCNVRFSTKWDADLQNFEYRELDGDAIISFSCQTAWYYPQAFLHWIKDTFNVAVFVMAIEESDEYAFYSEIDGEQYGQPYSVEHPYDEANAESNESYYDDWNNGEVEYYDEMFADFKELVDNYKE
jgi:hypothetical protein